MEKGKQISLSPHIVSTQNIQDLSSILSKYPQSVPIKIVSLSENREQNLKLALLTQNFCIDINLSQIGFEKWLICYYYQWKQFNFQLNNESRVCVIQENDNEEAIELSNNVCSVKTLRQAMNVVSMSKRELQIRKKMQNMLKKSQNKYNNNQSITNLIRISSNILIKTNRLKIRELSKYLQFYGQKRLKKLRSYLNKWLIYHYQQMINKREGQIIEGNYLLSFTNKTLLNKCFSKWKQMSLLHKIRK